MELLMIESLGKFGVKAHGTWYGVKRPVKVTDFVAGHSYEVETEVWEKNGKSGLNVTSVKGADNKAFASAPKQGQDSLPAKKENIDKSPTISYEQNKNRRILVQGVTQASLSCPALAGLSYSTVADLARNAKELALEMIAFVEEQSK